MNLEDRNRQYEEEKRRNRRAEVLFRQMSHYYYSEPVSYAVRCLQAIMEFVHLDKFQCAVCGMQLYILQRPHDGERSTFSVDGSNHDNICSPEELVPLKKGWKRGPSMRPYEL